VDIISLNIIFFARLHVQLKNCVTRRITEFNWDQSYIVFVTFANCEI